MVDVSARTKGDAGARGFARPGRERAPRQHCAISHPRDGVAIASASAQMFELETHGAVTISFRHRENSVFRERRISLAAIALEYAAKLRTISGGRTGNARAHPNRRLGF